MCRSTLLVLFLAVCLCRAEEPIRVNVRLVNVAFSARYSSGALVDNLTKDDLEIFERLMSIDDAAFRHRLKDPSKLDAILRLPYDERVSKALRPEEVAVEVCSPPLPLPPLLPSLPRVPAPPLLPIALLPTKTQLLADKLAPLVL